MPDVKTHSTLVVRNGRTLDRFGLACQEKGDDPWFLIIAYYKAMHHIEMLAARNSYHLGVHADRLDFLEQKKPTAKRCYHRLYVLSHFACYGESIDDETLSSVSRLINEFSFRNVVNSWLSAVERLG